MSQCNSVMNNLHRISHQLANAPEVGDIHAQEKNSVEKPVEKSVLDRALMRRYEDLLLTRKDLLEKVAVRLANCNEKQQTMQTEYAKLEENTARLKAHLDALQQNSCEFDPSDQGRLAAECRIVEDIRLDLVRLQSGTTYPETKTAEHGTTVPHGNFMTELCSLSFSQLMKFGFAITLPLLIMLLLCSVIVAVTYALVLGGI